MKTDYMQRFVGVTVPAVHSISEMLAIQQPPDEQGRFKIAGEYPWAAIFYAFNREDLLTLINSNPASSDTIVRIVYAPYPYKIEKWLRDIVLSCPYHKEPASRHFWSSIVNTLTQQRIHPTCVVCMLCTKHSAQLTGVCKKVREASTMRHLSLHDISSLYQVMFPPATEGYGPAIPQFVGSKESDAGWATLFLATLAMRPNDKTTEDE